MSKVFIEEDSLTAIGNAIRSKTGDTAPLSVPTGMVNAIASITTGGGSGGGDLSIYNGEIKEAYTDKDVKKGELVTYSSFTPYLKPVSLSNGKYNFFGDSYSTSTSYTSFMSYWVGNSIYYTLVNVKNAYLYQVVIKDKGTVGHSNKLIKRATLPNATRASATTILGSVVKDDVTYLLVLLGGSLIIYNCSDNSEFANASISTLLNSSADYCSLFNANATLSEDGEDIEIVGVGENSDNCYFYVKFKYNINNKTFSIDKKYIESERLGTWGYYDLDALYYNISPVIYLKTNNVEYYCFQNSSGVTIWNYTENTAKHYACGLSGNSTSNMKHFVIYKDNQALYLTRIGKSSDSGSTNFILQTYKSNDDFSDMELIDDYSIEGTIYNSNYGIRKYNNNMIYIDAYNRCYLYEYHLGANPILRDFKDLASSIGIVHNQMGEDIFFVGDNNEACIVNTSSKNLSIEYLLCKKFCSQNVDKSIYNKATVVDELNLQKCTNFSISPDYKYIFFQGVPASSTSYEYIIILENDITPRINANTWPIFKKTAVAMEDISAGGSGQVYVIK